MALYHKRPKSGTISLTTGAAQNLGEFALAGFNIRRGMAWIWLSRPSHLKFGTDLLRQLQGRERLSIICEAGSSPPRHQEDEAWNTSRPIPDYSSTTRWAAATTSSLPSGKKRLSSKCPPIEVTVNPLLGHANDKKPGTLGGRNGHLTGSGPVGLPWDLPSRVCTGRSVAAIPLLHGHGPYRQRQLPTLL
jgi:hypothetical protein